MQHRKRTGIDELWDMTCSRLRIGPSPDSRAVFEYLLTQYSNPDRHYHTMNHAVFCVHTAFFFFDSFEHPYEAIMALWFHDVIYDTHKTRGYNEHASAAVAQSLLKKLGLPEDRIEIIYKYILATQHSYEPEDHDCALVMDADLAQITAENPERTASRIRLEYSWVPRHSYVPERKKILKNLLGRDHFFNTEEFRNTSMEHRQIPELTLEEVARKNIISEIQLLGAKVIVGGTFDLFHEGHKRLIKESFRASSKHHGGAVTIGVTSEEMASKKSHPVQPYEVRVNQISDYIKSHLMTRNTYYGNQWKIVPLNDPVGDAGTGDYDILVASKETREGALKVNEIRAANRLPKLILDIIPPILDKSGQWISSTRLRREEELS